MHTAKKNIKLNNINYGIFLFVLFPLYDAIQMFLKCMKFEEF